VLALDADVLPLLPIDWLLHALLSENVLSEKSLSATDTQAAARARALGHGLRRRKAVHVPVVAAYREVAWPRWNSGIMLLRPSLCTLAGLLANATNAPDRRALDKQHYLGDQPVLNTAFRGRSTELGRVRHPGRNRTHRVATWASPYCRFASLNGTRELWAFAHLMGTKPYLCAHAVDCNTRYRCPRAHALFWRTFRQMRSAEQEACVRFGATPNAARAALHTARTFQV
jgi:hypothetical protein